MEKTRIIISDVYVLDLNSKEETRILDELIFGRTECDVTFPKDKSISRRHLRMVPTEGAVMIEDLGSRNNTLVNGKMLRPNVLYKLRSRDIVEFGEQKYQIFIGGKIAGGVKPEKGESQEVTAVFSKLMVDEKQPKPKKNGGRELDGLEDFSAMDTVPTFEESELVLSKLTNEQGVSWYLQFEGSEFGPLSFKEMKIVVSGKKFQGGELFVWAEGLPSWTPIDKSHRIFSSGVTSSVSAQAAEPVPLVAMVTWFVPDGATKRKITATCESISPEEITIACAEKLSTDRSFDIEVSPRTGLGIERFHMTVKLDPTRVGKKSYTLTVMSTPPKTKMVLERYIRNYYSAKK